MQNKEFQKQLSLLIAQGRAFQQNFKSEIRGGGEDCETDIEVGLSSLEDALKTWNKVKDAEEEEEHANSSRENYKDYWREECATTGRE